jgi:hypothetical protein
MPPCMWKQPQTLTGQDSFGHLTYFSRTLYEQTPQESTIYLGPWEVIGTDPTRVVWQCSYEGEVLEHYRTFFTKHYTFGATSRRNMT